MGKSRRFALISVMLIGVAGCGDDVAPADAGADTGLADAGLADTGGADTCPAGQELCGGACVDTATDDMHCGSCDMACLGGTTCMVGACVGGMDSGTGDAAPDAGEPAPASAAIMTVRTGTTPVHVPGAIVTYVRAAVGDDLAGFFVQAEREGPALFVRVDPTTLTPPPVVGDVLTFDVQSVETVEGRVEATAIDSYGVGSSGFDVSTLVQEVSDRTDLVSALDGYQSELVEGAVTVQTTFAGSGAGFTAAWADTSGSIGEMNLRVRISTAVRDLLDIRNGCSFGVGPSPFWRRNARAYFNVWDAADITPTSCTPPTIETAQATSATEVAVTFNRAMTAGSITAAATQFAVDMGLSVSTATVDGATVTLTTSTQSPGATYLLTVANTVLDAFGAPLAAGTESVSFQGFIQRARVQINEISPAINLGGGQNCDLIELRVEQGGALGGFVLEARGSIALGAYNIVTFPTMEVATNDLIVVHLDGADCNVDGSPDETTAVNAAPNTTYGANYDGAWDLYDRTTTADGITMADNVIRVLDPSGAYVDAVPFVGVSDCSGFAASAPSERRISFAAGASEWERVSGGVPAGGFVDTEFCLHAVRDASLTGPGTADRSLARTDDTDDNNASDWSDANVSSFGALNPGQSAF